MSRVLSLLSVSFFILYSTYVMAQGATCATANQICGTTPPFPANTSGGTAVGSIAGSVGCLSTTPNESWFFFEVAVAGNISGSVTNSNNLDVDGAIFGPFASTSVACSGLNASNIVACDWSGSSIVPVNFNAVPGIYMVLITNYSEEPTTISLSFTGASNSIIDCIAESADYNICEGDAPQTMSATVLSSTALCPPAVSSISCLTNTPATTGSYTTNVSTSVNASCNISGVPAGATITNVSYSILGGALNGSYCQELRVNVNGPGNTYDITGGTLAAVNSGECTLASLASVGGWSGTSTNSPNGTYTFSFYENIWNEAGASQDFSVIQLEVVVTYESGPPPDLTWFNTQSGGTAIGTSSPFQPVAAGGSDVSNTNTSGVYDFWVGCGNDGIRSQVQIFIHDIPTITSTSAVCAGSTFTATINSPAISTSPPGCSWQYSFDGGSTWGSSNTLTGIAPGSGNRTVLVRNSCRPQCVSASQIIVIPASIVPTFAAVGPYCAGASIPALPTSSTNSPAITGTWSPAINNTTTTPYTFTPATNQCATTAPLTITINPRPTVAVNSSTVCIGTSATVTATPGASGSYSYVWTVPGGFTNPGDVPSFTTTVAGTYSVIITNTATGCESLSASGNVTVNPLAIVNAGTDQSVCAGGSVTLAGTFGGSATSATWSAPSGSFSSTSNMSATYAPSLTSGTVTLTLTSNDPAGPCPFVTSQVVITINPLPTIGGTLSACINNSSQLTGSGTPDGTTPWTSSNSAVASVSSTGLVSALSSGTSTITYTNSDGCQITAIFTVNPLPTIGGTLSACINNTRQLTGSATANAVTPWTSSNTGVATVSSTGLVTAVSAGTTTITYTNSNGCQNTAVFTVNPLPIIVADDVSTCLTNPVAINATGATTYSWSPGTFLSATTGASVTFTPGSNTTYTVTGSDLNGCVGTDLVSVSILPNAPIVASADVTICNGATTNISALGGVSYTWNQGLGAGQNFDVTPSTTTTYTVTGTDAAGCVGSDVVVVTVNPLPTVNAVTPQTICAGANTTTITFSGAVVGTTYNWTNSNSTIGLAASGSGNITSFTGVNTGSVDQVANITVTPESNGCFGTPINFTITVNPIPTVNAIPNQVLCANSPTSAVNFTGLVTPTTYNWTNSNGAIGLATSGTGNLSSVTATNSTGAPITGTITVTPTANGCPGTPQNFTITVNPIPTVSAVANQVICANANTTTVAFTGNVSGATYNWINSNSSIGLSSTGSGDITSFSGLNSSASPQVATINVTPTSNGCTGTPISFTVTVNPIPTVNSVSNQVLCPNATTAQVDFSGLVAGTTYNWTNSNTSIGLAGSGSGTINAFTAINNGSIPAVSTITVTPISAGCSGTPTNFTITVNPTPTVNTIGNQTVCANGNTTDVNFSGNVAGTTFNWTNTNSSIGLASSGNGNILSFTALNGGSTSQVGTINITPTVNGCPGTPTSFTITVNPTPVITALSNQTVCSGAITSAVNFASNVAGTNYSWTNSNTSIGLPASGNGNIGGFTATNFTASQISGVISVTPSANACTGLPTNFTIFVNPLPTATVTGTASVCENGTSPVVTFTGSNGTANYTFTYNINGGANQTIVSSGNTATINAPTTPTGSFNYNLISVADASSTTCSQAQGGSATITINPNPTPTIVGATEYCAGTTASVSTSLTYSSYLWSPNSATTQTTNVTNADNPITVMVTNGFGCQGTSAPFTVTENSVIIYDTQVEICQGQSAMIHGISRTVANVYSQTFILPSGCDSTSNVTLIVHALPVIDAGPDVTVCEGTQVLVNATGAPTITWSPVVTNGQYITQAPSTVVYTATGTDVNGCQNTDAFSVTVNPTPSANSILNQTICAATNTTAINFTGPIVGTTYAWTNDNALIGAAATGNGNIASFTGLNSGASLLTGNFTVTPTANSCPGTPIQFSITINPVPSVDPIADQTICANVLTDAVTINGSVIGTTYNWINSNTTIGIGGTGSGSIAAFTGTNAGSTIQTGNFTVTPVANGCTGLQQLFSIAVNPIPVVSSAPDQIVCQGAATVAANFTSGVIGTTYSWTNNNGGIGLATSGNGSIASFTSANAGATPITGTISVTPTANACNGVVDQFLITVNPTPSVNAISDIVLCAGQTISVPISGGVTPSTYTWTNSNTSIGLAANGTGSINTFTTQNVTSTPQVATIIVTPTASSCPGPTETFTITVNPIPPATSIADQIICAGDQSTLVDFNEIVAGTTFAWTNNNPGIGLAASGSNDINPFTTVNGGGSPIQGSVTVTPSANGCTGPTDVFVITVRPLPTASISGTTALCLNGPSPTVTFTGGNGVAPYTFNYTLNGTPFSVQSSGNNATVSAPTNVAGVFNYTLVSVSDASSTACDQAQSGTATITIHALPVVDAGEDQEVCIGESVTLQGDGAMIYSWNPAITNNVPFVPTLGNTLFTVTGTDNNGCINQDQVNVLVNPLPVIGAGPDDAICLGESVTLSGTGPAGTDFVWNNPDVVDGVAFSPTATQSYTVTGTDVNGCVNTDMVIIVVNQLPVVNAGNNLTGCSGDDFILTGSGAGVNGTYSWDNSVINGQSFVAPVGTTTYTVTGTDANGCQDQDDLTIFIQEAPIISFDFVQDGNCAPVTVTFTNTSTPQGTNCIWHMDDGAVINGCGPILHTFNTPGSYGVMLQSETVENGCMASAYFADIINVSANPIAAFSADPTNTTTINTEIEFENLSTGATSYIWNFGDNSGNSTVQNPSHTYTDLEAGFYIVTLIANTPAGCSDTATLGIDIDEELLFYVPNTFTPDADQYNETFQPVFTSGFDPFDFTLLIFNRWGELIFESHNAEIGWNGRYGVDGNECQDGAYTWKIEFKTTSSDARKVYVGHVNLLR